MEVPTDEGLKKLFEQKKLFGLIAELEDGTTTFEQFQRRSKEDWKDITGKAAGVDIFNYLRPEKTHDTAVASAKSLFLVIASISNALSTKGVRARLYRLADNYLGYYDPQKPNALYYQGTTLNVHVVFENKADALHFESHLRAEKVTMNSALNSLEIQSSVEQMESNSSSLARIYYEHYNATESESPQDTISQIGTAECSYFQHETEEFKYQRIEADWVFGSLGKAESCHLMSREHCRAFESLIKYDADKSNRLALSREFHGFYDALSFDLPIVNLVFSSRSEQAVVDGRFKIELVVRVLNAEYKERVFSRLKSSSALVEGDELAMMTTVLVLNPIVFIKCLEWKSKQIQKRWDDYFNMESAID